METWIVAFMAIAASFLVKFSCRKSKTDPNFWFWIKDNYPEVAVSVLFMLILLIIGREIEFDADAITAKIPYVKALPLDLIFAALAGYYNNVLWYAVVKKLKAK